MESITKKITNMQNHIVNIEGTKNIHKITLYLFNFQGIIEKKL